jgi:ribonuclease P protein component
VTRRNRLSRSRDFAAVYRNGHSVSTRYLTLYSFLRPDGEGDGEPRLGLAVSRHVGGAVVRNRVKRQLRACFDEFRPSLAPDRDYVLVVRSGLAEAAETRGFPWLRDKVAEVLGLAGAVDEGGE